MSSSNYAANPKLSRTLTLMTDGPWVQGGSLSLVLIRDSFPSLSYNAMCIDLFRSSLGFSLTAPGDHIRVQISPCCLKISNKWQTLFLDSLTLFLIVTMSVLSLIYQVAGKWAFQSPWIALGSGEFEGQVTALGSSGSLSQTWLKFLDIRAGCPSFEGESCLAVARHVWPVLITQ